MFGVFSYLTAERDGQLVVVTGLICLLAILVAIALFHRARTGRRQPRRELTAGAEEQWRQQNIRLDTALNNMSQGLCMFNAEEEVVVFNRRFLEMYKLSPQVVKPGCKFRDLIQHRKEVGLLEAEPESYYRGIVDDIRRGKTRTSLARTTQGRLIQVFNQPLPGGGWVTTHEDVTERHLAEDQVREQKLQMDAALNNISQGVVMFGADTRLILCNRRYLELYGLSPDDVKPGMALRDLLVLRKKNATFRLDPEIYIGELQAALAVGNSVTLTPELADGRTICIENHPLADGRWVSTHEDITERRRTEMERDRSQAFANIVVENVPATIAVKDAKTLRYVLVNRAGEEHFGVPRAAMVGKRADEIFDKEEAETIAGHDRKILEAGTPQFYDERPVVTPGGSRRIVSTTKMPIRDSHGDIRYLLTVVDDRTHRRRAEAQIARLVHHDPLTNLPNRAAFTACIDATIETATKDGSSFALMCLDFDRFKEVNDVYGHAAGDELLHKLSTRLQAAVGGAFLARLSGDEFVVIANDGAQPAAAEVLADRLLAVVNEPIPINGHSVSIGLTVGIAIFPVDGADAATLVNNADAALFRAKAEGRGSFRFFEADMDQRLRERRVLQQELRSAIERGELVLHYQPQARINGDIFGFEALVRWQHPQRGTIAPGIFIPLAEESGLIIAMSEWVMREACREAASWPKKLQIAINLSPVQFRHGDLPGLVHSMLLETGLSPSRLELEITEGVLVDDFSRAVSTLRRLKALGVRIAMDDFGTGYSSLSYLQSFPFDKIKIDRSFISNLGSNNQAATIVRAVIGLARGLELPVLAEGVETKEQLAFLAKESCDAIQGYLFGRPLPIDDYAALVGRPSQVPAVAAAS
jgi:diguanylate cyclase (GGDEF)-like protein/PAS domain S-box-containing protein